MNIKRFKQTQKFRVIVSLACFYATAKQIRNGVGDMGRCNAAIQKALDTLEFQRSGDDALACSVGIGGTWEGVDVQLNVAG